MLPNTKRLSNTSGYVRPQKTYQDNLSNAEIKEKLKDGIKIKELSKVYPQMSYSYLYSIRNGSRWGDL
jgi:Mor family transcriptional regulator